MKYIHFNNAGASLTPKSTNDVINKYLELERKIGGYEAEELSKNQLDQFYLNFSKLINSRKSEISFLPNATIAWNMIFNSIPILERNNIVICENEYSSNHISILNRLEKTKIRIVKLDKRGLIDLNELKKKVDINTKVLSINHISSQFGNVMPILEIGKIVKNINSSIIYIVDCCQSIGQCDIDVKKINCDIITGSGRKYLMGPRGTGFLYISKKLSKKIHPIFKDMSSTKLNRNFNLVQLEHCKPLLETFEHSPALKLGLSQSINNILKIGVNKINEKIVALSNYFRLNLCKVCNVKFFEHVDYLSGINTMDFLDFDNEEVYKYLRSFNINTYVVKENVSKLYFKKIRRKNVLRVSFNYNNNKSQIDYLIKTIKML